MVVCPASGPKARLSRTSRGPCLTGRGAAHMVPPMSSDAATNEPRWQRVLADLVGRPVFWVVLVTSLFAFPLVRSFLRPLPAERPVLGEMPSFVAPQAAGNNVEQPLTSESLRGKIWVATFIEPMDPDCERLGEALMRVQRRSRNLGDAWRLVSFVPGGAEPSSIEAFARRRHPNALRWFFAAVPPAVESAVEKAMYHAAVLAPLPGTGASRVHGKHLGVLVDSHGRIRGFYDLLSPSGENAVLEDMGLLANLAE
jgi:hypothetical protein